MRPRTHASLSFLAAAERVLSESGRAMTSPEILSQAIARRLVLSKGKTPERTLAAALYKDVAKNPRTRFVCMRKMGSERAIRGTVKWSLKSGTGEKR
jgi:hypothetical protein